MVFHLEIVLIKFILPIAKGKKVQCLKKNQNENSIIIKSNQNILNQKEKIKHHIYIVKKLMNQKHLSLLLKFKGNTHTSYYSIRKIDFWYKYFYSLGNIDFKPSMIENWKTFGNNDILKDYYFQINKPLTVFKGQMLEIQPICKRPLIEPLTFKDFQIVRCIGIGGFSRVFLVRLKNNGKFYALKLMEKQGLFQSGKQCVVINEIYIIVDLDSLHIQKLQFSFETRHFVALGLECCPGGQLFYYLIKIRRMNQDEARYCFVEILLGLQYLHSNKIIYIDINPKNIMIDMYGNLKIADFCLSKLVINPNQLAYTYCGSPQYMAPQMLNKSGHRYSVGYYCLGSLLYQLVTGNPPFYQRNVQKIYFSIQNQQIGFPAHIELSNQIKMFLQGLLVKDHNRRLGPLGRIRQILGHPWVGKIKTTNITQKKMKTSIKIDLLAFNVNEEQVDDDPNNFYDKLKNEDNNFQPMFNILIFILVTFRLIIYQKLIFHIFQKFPHNQIFFYNSLLFLLYFQKQKQMEKQNQIQ